MLASDGSLTSAVCERTDGMNRTSFAVAVSGRLPDSRLNAGGCRWGESLRASLRTNSQNRFSYSELPSTVTAMEYNNSHKPTRINHSLSICKARRDGLAPPIWRTFGGASGSARASIVFGSVLDAGGRRFACERGVRTNRWDEPNIVRRRRVGPAARLSFERGRLQVGRIAPREPSNQLTKSVLVF
jgi:hypothetical protein